MRRSRWVSTRRQTSICLFSLDDYSAVIPPGLFFFFFFFLNYFTYDFLFLFCC